MKCKKHEMKTFIYDEDRVYEQASFAEGDKNEREMIKKEDMMQRIAKLIQLSIESKEHMNPFYGYVIRGLFNGK